MKASLSWIEQYVPVEMDISDLAEALTMAGLEVDSVENRYAWLDTVVVGLVISVAPHPNADKLQCCEVDVGGGTILPIVCGAPNVAKDQLCPVALPGTVFPEGHTIKKGKIRGQVSKGMICSAVELHLGTDKSGIMVLDSTYDGKAVTVGESLPEACGLSDYMIEIDLTPNRSDCLSIIGIAREIAAIQNKELNYPDFSKGISSPYEVSGEKDEISKMASVTIEAPDHCGRYAARLLDSICVKESPFWLQDRLMSVGLRPINNIVDITNFVMMETGQPLHGFDFDQLADKKIIVKTAGEGEKFTTLDNKERTLSSDMLMICDGKGPVGIAGVMGGLNSEIEDTTTRVLIESACFDPISIRRTAKRLGLGTDASHRFERGVDPLGTVNAVNRAASLMAQIAGGRIIDGLIDEHPVKPVIKPIALSVEKTHRLLGVTPDAEEIADMLKAIEFRVKIEDELMVTVTAPSYRVDVERPEDLMEEVARLYGYDHIPTTDPMQPLRACQLPKLRVIRDKIRDIMRGMGFCEAINYSFISKNACDQLKMAENDPRRSLLHILNPLTEDQGVMRTSLIPGLLGNMGHNLAQQVKNLKFFETGKIFIGKGQDEQPEEKEILSCLWTGARQPLSWHSKEIFCDFYDLKGSLEGLMAALGIDGLELKEIPDSACDMTKPGSGAVIFVNDVEIGKIGEVHPDVLKAFDLKQAAFIFEIDLDLLIPMVPDEIEAVPVPRFPAIDRDATLIVEKKIPVAKILDAVTNMKEPLVADVFLFDVYEGEAIGADKKSVSFRITYRSLEKTLKDKAITKLHQRITKKVIDTFDAGLPE